MLFFSHTFSVVTWSLDVVFAMNYGGEVQKYQISPYAGMPLSVLSFANEDISPTLQLIHRTRKSEFSLQFTYNPSSLSKGVFDDIDYDIAREFSSVENTYSQVDIRSKANIIKTGWRILYTFDKWFMTYLNMKMYWRLGYYYATTSYLVKDAKQWYPTGEEFYSNNGRVGKQSTSYDSEINARSISGEVLRYDTRFHGPVVGAKTHFNLKRHWVQLGVLWSPLLTIEDRDYHVLRDKMSHSLHEGFLLGGNVNLNVALFNRMDLQILCFLNYIKGSSGAQTQTTYTDSNLLIVQSQVGSIPHSFYAVQYGLRLGLIYEF